jgi:CTP synthase (UTP-ammonia lyase)
MSEPIRIALVGDFDPALAAHQAIPHALQISAARLGVQAAPSWVPTELLGPQADQLKAVAAVWCVPGSPYVNMDGALSAIRFVREAPLPFLGTCGGFQHAILEYARNVFGFALADHAETAPSAVMPVISRLTCSLVGATGEIRFAVHSGLRKIYGVDKATEEYHCNFGLNPEYERVLTSPSGLRVTGRDRAGEVRAIELAGHPFFFATLFQPERSALRGIEHPLVTAFVAAAMNESAGNK